MKQVITGFNQSRYLLHRIGLWIPNPHPYIIEVVRYTHCETLNWGEVYYL